MKALLFILCTPLILALIAALCAWASFAASWSAGQDSYPPLSH